jgi:cob(I)alamin adenosyltransferase
MSEPIKFYSTTGDDGTTGLLGEGRVKKYHPRPEAYGTVDEAQAALGIARAEMLDQDAAAILLQAQRDLYHLMSELAATKEAASKFRFIDTGRVKWLEELTDFYGAKLNLPREFSVSGDSASGAYLDLARTIVRRAERLVVRLFDEQLVDNRELIRYLNRLSALCYVLSRYEDALSGHSTVTLARTAPRKRKSKSTRSTQRVSPAAPD